MIVNHFGCTVVHKKVVYKCHIHSFIQVQWLAQGVVLIQVMHVSIQLAIYPNPIPSFLNEGKAVVEEESSSRTVGKRKLPGLDGSKLWRDRSNGQTCGSQSHAASDSHVQAVYDVLPSPSNLHHWDLADTTACSLCQRKGTLGAYLQLLPKAAGGV